MTTKRTKKKPTTLAQAIKNPIFTGMCVLKAFDVPKEPTTIGLHLAFNSERDKAIFIKKVLEEEE